MERLLAGLHSGGGTFGAASLSTATRAALPQLEDGGAASRVAASILLQQRLQLAALQAQPAAGQESLVQAWQLQQDLQALGNLLGQLSPAQHGSMAVAPLQQHGGQLEREASLELWLQMPSQTADAQQPPQQQLVEQVPLLAALLPHQLRPATLGDLQPGTATGVQRQEGPPACSPPRPTASEQEDSRPTPSSSQQPALPPGVDTTLTFLPSSAGTSKRVCESQQPNKLYAAPPATQQPPPSRHDQTWDELPSKAILRLAKVWQFGQGQQAQQVQQAPLPNQDSLLPLMPRVASLSSGLATCDSELDGPNGASSSNLPASGCKEDAPLPGPAAAAAVPYAGMEAEQLHLQAPPAKDMCSLFPSLFPSEAPASSRKGEGQAAAGGGMQLEEQELELLPLQAREPQEGPAAEQARAIQADAAEEQQGEGKPCAAASFFLHDEPWPELPRRTPELQGVHSAPAAAPRPCLQQGTGEEGSSGLNGLALEAPAQGIAGREGSGAPSGHGEGDGGKEAEDGAEGSKPNHAVADKFGIRVLVRAAVKKGI